MGCNALQMQQRPSECCSACSLIRRLGGVQGRGFLEHIIAPTSPPDCDLVDNVGVFFDKQLSARNISAYMARTLCGCMDKFLSGAGFCALQQAASCPQASQGDDLATAQVHLQNQLPMTLLRQSKERFLCVHGRVCAAALSPVFICE